MEMKKNKRRYNSEKSLLIFIQFDSFYWFYLLFFFYYQHFCVRNEWVRMKVEFICHFSRFNWSKIVVHGSKKDLFIKSEECVEIYCHFKNMNLFHSYEKITNWKISFPLNSSFSYTIFFDLYVHVCVYVYVRFTIGIRKLSQLMVYVSFVL